MTSSHPKLVLLRRKARDIASWRSEYVASHAGMWRSYLASIGEPDGPGLSDVIVELKHFLAPVLVAVQEHLPSKATWDHAHRSWED